MKIKLFICCFIIILTSGCVSTRKENVKQGENDYEEMEAVSMKNNDNKQINESKNENIETPNKKNERVFLNLNYLGDMDNVNYRVRRMPLELNLKEDFTWWNYYTIDEYLSSSEYYDFILPDEVDNTKHDIIISFGRKLKYLYYYEKDYNAPKNDFLPGEEGYRARPIFEKDFIKNSAYVYLIDKINLADSEIASEDMSKFLKGKIPFEIPPIEDEINEPKMIHYNAAFRRSYYDPTAFYEEWGFKVDSPLTLWDKSENERKTLELAEKYKFVPPSDFDYNSYDLIISYGRQMPRMEYQEIISNEKHDYVFIATFAEEHWGNQIFFYQIEKQPFLPWYIASPCYIFEKYIGPDLFYINDSDKSKQEENSGTP